MSAKKFTDERLIDAMKWSHCNTGLAADKLGVNQRSVQRRINELTDEQRNEFAMVMPILPDGHHLRGVSSLQKVMDPETGQVVMQWVKTAADPKAAESQLREVLDALKSEVPRYKPIKAQPDLLQASLLNTYVLTDYHMGMYAWGEETGDDWDTHIAEDLLVQWFQLAIERSPKASNAILAQLGDFLHYDSLDAVTPTSRNVLDADTRAQMMVRVSLRVLRRVVNMLLARHEFVTVIMAEGNHDIMASAWLREAFALMYENEPRVAIVDRPDPYYAVQWGQTGLFFHHGHLKKPEQVDRVFARKFREIYGESKYCYGHMGHMHNKLVIESALMKVEQHPTLAAADAYASRSGYMSDRNACVITYDKEFGEVNRNVISPELVKALQSQ